MKLSNRALLGVPLLMGVLSLLLIHPIAGELVRFDREHSAALLLSETQTLAGVLAGDQRFLSALESEERYLYEALPVSAPITIDGRDSDWPAGKGSQLSIDHLLEIFFPYTADTLKATFKVGTSPDRVYLHFNVTDDFVVFRDLNSISVHRNDHIQIGGIDSAGHFRKMTLAVFQPSVIKVQEVSPETGRALREIEGVEARWIATAEGYNVEVSLPRELVSQGFSAVVVDVDDETSRDIRFVMGHTPTVDAASLGLLMPSPTPLQNLVAELAGQVTITDASGEVLAESATTDSESDLPFLEATVEITSGTRRLGTMVIQRAYSEPDYARVLLLVPLLVLFGTGAGLLLVLVVLKRRQQEQQDMEATVERTRQYNNYLERMAARLNHELRTPITVVKSSLEHLDATAENQKDRVYVGRALEGVHRLNSILNKMAEARRLEEALNEEEVIRFDLVELVKGCVSGYEAAYAPQAFELLIESSSVPVTGIPELMAQLFDKIIDNAVSFSSGEPVRVRLTVEAERCYLRVLNQGPVLPDTDNQSLFESMVRHRHDDRAADHLGLGLYIANTIAEFHGGYLKIANREDIAGVIVTVEVPVLRITSKLK